MPQANESPAGKEAAETLLDRVREEWETAAKPLLWLIYSALHGSPNAVSSAKYADSMVEEFKKRFIPEDE